MRFIYLFLITLTLYGQSSSTNDAIGTPEVKSNKTKSAEEPITFDDDELDKEFYTYYYMNLPKHLQKEDKDKKKLDTNLIRAFKKEIAKRDRTISKEAFREITNLTIKSKRVFEDSKWMKQIKKEMKYIKFTDFMYIVKYKNYLTLIIYHLDPEMHLQSPSQVEFIMTKEIESKLD